MAAGGPSDRRAHSSDPYARHPGVRADQAAQEAGSDDSGDVGREASAFCANNRVELNYLLVRRRLATIPPFKGLALSSWAFVSRGATRSLGTCAATYQELASHRSAEYLDGTGSRVACGVVSASLSAHPSLEIPNTWQRARRSGKQGVTVATSPTGRSGYVSLTECGRRLRVQCKRLTLRHSLTCSGPSGPWRA